MTTQSIYLPSPSPYSSDPIADAKSRIAARTGSTSFPTASCLAWADPQTAMGVGTGGWQFAICQEYTPPGSGDSIMYCVQCGGNSATSVGGSPAAPQPSFTGFAMQNSPLWSGGGGGSIVSGAVGNNGSIYNVSVGPFDAQIAADFAQLCTTWDKSPSFCQFYYYDPQTAVGAGRGIWQLVWQIWEANYNNMFAQLSASGCTLNGAGVKGQPAPSFGSALQIKGPFKLF